MDPYTVFRARRITFFPVNRVENQNEPKRPQGGGRLGSFRFSTRPTAMGGIDYNALALWEKLRSCSSNRPIIQVHYNQCLPLPQAELKTKTNPNGRHSVAVWVRFGFQLDSLEKSDHIIIIIAPQIDFDLDVHFCTNFFLSHHHIILDADLDL